MVVDIGGAAGGSDDFATDATIGVCIGSGVGVEMGVASGNGGVTTGSGVAVGVGTGTRLTAERTAVEGIGLIEVWI
mgnify:CR=1 FL=1